MHFDRISGVAVQLAIALMIGLFPYAHSTAFAQRSPAFATGPAADFGSDLPRGVSFADIRRITAPHVDSALVTLVGMKKWPLHKNSYIAIVCASNSKRALEEDTDFADGKPDCNAGYGGIHESTDPKTVYLAVLSVADTLKRVASYPGPLDIAVQWKNSNIPKFGEEGGSLFPGSYDRFDFAHYRVSDHQDAFGIRVGWQSATGGGSAYYMALLLFLVQGDKIINIFSEPIGFEIMVGGEWKEDGSRDHDYWEQNNVIEMLPSKTSGFYDLKIKDPNDDWFKVFLWNASANRYEARPL